MVSFQGEYSSRNWSDLLGSAFFYAGTRALLVSNWPVEITSARVLTSDLFRRQAADAALTRAQALRQAMLGLVDGPGLVDGKGRSLFSYAHPLFWAPFSLIGDGGGNTVESKTSALSSAGLRLVHRGVRHRRSKGGKDAVQ